MLLPLRTLKLIPRARHDIPGKSSVAEIRARFDSEVERFSNLETGQSATIDAPLVMDLIARAASATNPRATHALGAGNYSLKHLPGLRIVLVDLSALPPHTSPGTSRRSPVLDCRRLTANS